MKAFGRPELAWVLIVGGAAIGAFFVFRDPEPARTALELVAGVCGDASERRDLVERHVAEPLEVWWEESSGGGEREYTQSELGSELAELNAVWPACSFSLEDWRVRPHVRGASWVEGSLRYSASEASDLHAQRRALRALFREVNGEQRLERVVIGELERSLPEPRP